MHTTEIHAIRDVLEAAKETHPGTLHGLNDHNPECVKLREAMKTVDRLLARLEGLSTKEPAP